MQALNFNQLSELITTQPKPCVSIYLPVADFANAAEAEGAVKSSLKQTYDLIKGNEGEHKARFLIEPLKGMVSLIKRPPPEGTKTLAVFRSFTTAAYHASPVTTKELAVVADTFHLKPFLHALQGLDRYFVLNLRQKSASLFEGSESSFRRIARVDLEEVDRDERVATFRPRSRVMRFMKEVEEEVWERLREESAPLILSGTSFLHQMYRSLNRYGKLCEEGIHSSFGSGDLKALHTASYQIAERLLMLKGLEAADRFYPRKRLGLASDALGDIAQAAVRGRIGTLFVCRKTHLWGVLDRAVGKLELREAQADTRDDDVLDDIAQEVIQRHGRVFVLDPKLMPAYSPVAALYRW